MLVNSHTHILDHIGVQGVEGDFEMNTFQQEKKIDVERYHKCDSDLKWYGMYGNDTKYKAYVSPETNKHPAKMSLKLADTIVKHLERLRLIKQGDRIIDFMAGTARTGIVAELNGYPFIGIELESHFTDLIDLNRQTLKNAIHRDPSWTIIHGDAQKLSELLNQLKNGYDKKISVRSAILDECIVTHGYSAIVSPPYGSIEIGKGLNTKPPRPGHNDQSGRSAESPSQKMTRYAGITSPAYGQAPDRISKGNPQEGSVSDAITRTYEASNHGKTEGQIGNLKDIGIVSPPYGLGVGLGHGGKLDRVREQQPWLYGSSNGQIGNQTDGTYLSAMLKVYSEAFKAGISPLVTVTKNPTKNRQLRRLEIDTALLLEQAGYEIVDYHQAMLFKTQTQITLSGEMKPVIKGQLSFFKRISVQKGNVAADHEDILIAVIPEKRVLYEDTRNEGGTLMSEQPAFYCKKCGFRRPRQKELRIRICPNCGGKIE